MKKKSNSNLRGFLVCSVFILLCSWFVFYSIREDRKLQNNQKIIVETINKNNSIQENKETAAKHEKLVSRLESEVKGFPFVGDIDIDGDLDTMYNMALKQAKDGNDFAAEFMELSCEEVIKAYHAGKKQGNRMWEKEKEEVDNDYNIPKTRG